MAVTKRVIIEFASPDIRAIDNIQDIRRATESASLNLNARYDVILQYPMPTDDERVYLDVRIPDELVDSFSYGKRLRGLSNYLLKNCGGKYQQYLVGNRLLTYTLFEEDGQDSKRKPGGISMAERLEAIADFARLLERSDEDAIFHINRIMLILKEAAEPEKND